jgi:pimeloyl-ACP methyl ester carboxylesterase
MPSYPSWPEPSFVATNGIRMAVYEAGPAEGSPPLVLCHGFPELAFSWRHQLIELGQRGFRVIAPDQRGYGLTEAPAEVASYDVEHLCGDLLGLLDARGIGKAVFVGHDWGGIVVWQMGARHPERCAGVIGLNTPYIPRAPADPIAIMRERLGEEMYIVHFQKAGEADEILARDVFRTMNFMMRKPPKSASPSAGLNSQRGDGSGSVFPLVRMIEAYDPSMDTRETFLTDAEMQVFVDAFSRTGFTGGINWYRNMTRNWERGATIADRVEAPSLMIMAENDPVLPPSAADGMEKYVPNLEKRLVRNSGHWTQQERPDEVTSIIIEWMGKTFGAPRSSEHS